jgi:hypothetical protein
MPRKKNKRSKNAHPSDLASLEASAKQLQSLLVMPEMWQLSRSGAFQGIRKKLLKIDYLTIRNVVDKVPLISAIINTRIDQVKSFLQYTEEKGEEGYHFSLRDPRKEPTEKDEKLFYQLAEFLDQTGIEYDSMREDDFSDYVEMFVRETLVVDQVATELQRNRKGEVIAFWALDGASIQRVDPEKASKHTLISVTGERVTLGKDDRFVQVVEDRITNTYTNEDLIFDYKNKRADLRFRGFGYSAVEQCIDMITTLLFGYNYLRDQMIRDRVPKGFIQVMGDVGREQLDGIREYWYSAMSGAGGTWNIPVLPSGKDGIGLDWKNIQPSNRDMEYHRSMMFLTSIISAVFGMDPAEMGLKTDDSQAIIGENSEPRISQSKDRGLASMLSFIAQHVNKILRKVNEDYKFEFIGLKKDDENKLADLRRKNVETYLTINEIREADGLAPIEEDYANVVLNPQAIQIYNASKMQEGGGGMFGGGDFGEEEEGVENPAYQDEGRGEGMGEGTEEDETQVDWESLFKSLGEDKSVKVVVK